MMSNIFAKKSDYFFIGVCVTKVVKSFYFCEKSTYLPINKQTIVNSHSTADCDVSVPHNVDELDIPASRIWFTRATIY